MASPCACRLKEVVKVCKGKETEVFKRSGATDAPDFLCFSVSTADRTLDLQAVSVEVRDLWVRAVESVMRVGRRLFSLGRLLLCCSLVVLAD